MNQKDIIRMAREAGWSGIYTQWAEPTGKPDWTPVKYSLTVPVTMEQIERFFHAAYAAGAAAEREACARICDEKAKRNFNWGSENADRYHAQADWAVFCAASIRARSKT